MHKLITFSAAAAVLALTGLPAAATVNKTWVSSSGTDTGTCQLVTPCKTFAYAISQTAAGGEVDVKDSGAYGAFVINKSISIVADGVVASVGTSASGRGIDIENTDVDTVTIHGLTVNTHDMSIGIGIYVNSIAYIVIDKNLIEGSETGINVNSAAHVIISNNTITSNSIGLGSSSAGTYVFNNVISGNSFAGAQGTFNTYGNNAINGNGYCDICGTATKVAAE